MVARPYWSGNLRLSLVSVPVNIYAAVNASQSVAFHEIYRPTGKRVHHQLVAGDKVIQRDDVVKGYEYKKGRYVLIEPKEIQELKLPSKNALEIVQFVPSHEIEPFYFEKPYFVVPQEGSDEDAFATIREGLRTTGTYGVGQLTIGGRERLCALKPCGRGMMLDTLRYKDEVRKADEYFDDIDAVKVGKDELTLIEQLIKQKTGAFTPDKFHDHYREALRELIDAKLENRAPEYEQEEPEAKVVNLMDALKRSLGRKNKGKSGKKKAGVKTEVKSKVTAIPKPKAPVKKPAKARRKAG